MPGSGMPPAATDDPAALRALATFVQGLVCEDVPVQQRRRLTVARVDDAVPEDPDDPRWDFAAGIDLVLAPLVRHGENVRAAELAALHDGRRIALRMRWNDATRDDRTPGESLWPDAAALQFSSDPEPPLFGMGTHDAAANVWHWQAFDPDAVTGYLDVAGPHAAAGGLFETAIGAEGVRAAGVESADRMASLPTPIGALPRWRDGSWSVVFVRDLEGAGTDEIAFVPGGTVQAACAIWNGAGDDHGLRKSISIWQELALDP
jgi:DMSO reductase family type II enzyme heme b subunit